MKIDLDEIEVSLYYLEEWKKVIEELRAARLALDVIRRELPSYNCDCSFSMIKGAIKRYEESVK